MEPNAVARRSALEVENPGLAQQFFNDLAKRDVEFLPSYVAEGLIYQMIEGEPNLISRAAFVEVLVPAFKAFHTVEMKILRHHPWINLFSPCVSIRWLAKTKRVARNFQLPVTALFMMVE
jgi:hypothetical protein